MNMPARHYRPLTAHQRDTLLRRIDAMEQRAMNGQPEPSLTHEPLLLRTPPTQAPTLRNIKPPRAYTGCRPGMCESRPGCADTACHGHPLQMCAGQTEDRDDSGFDAPRNQRDPKATRAVLLALLAFWLVAGFSAWHWLTN